MIAAKRLCQDDREGISALPFPLFVHSFVYLSGYDLAAMACCARQFNRIGQKAAKLRGIHLNAYQALALEEEKQELAQRVMLEPDMTTSFATKDYGLAMNMVEHWLSQGSPVDTHDTVCEALSLVTRLLEREKKDARKHGIRQRALKVVGPLLQVVSRTPESSLLCTSLAGLLEALDRALPDHRVEGACRWLLGRVGPFATEALATLAVARAGDLPAALIRSMVDRGFEVLVLVGAYGLTDRGVTRAATAAAQLLAALAPFRPEELRQGGALGMVAVVLEELLGRGSGGGEALVVCQALLPLLATQLGTDGPEPCAATSGPCAVVARLLCKAMRLGHEGTASVVLELLRGQPRLAPPALLAAGALLELAELLKEDPDAPEALEALVLALPPEERTRAVMAELRVMRDALEGEEADGTQAEVATLLAFPLAGRDPVVRAELQRLGAPERVAALAADVRWKEAAGALRAAQAALAEPVGPR